MTGQEDPLVAKLTTAARKKLPASDYALPEKRAYPIPPGDKAHAANAKARAAQFASPPEKAQIDAKANRVLYGSSAAPKGRTGGAKKRSGK